MPTSFLHPSWGALGLLHGLLHRSKEADYGKWGGPQVARNTEEHLPKGLYLQSKKATGDFGIRVHAATHSKAQTGERQKARGTRMLDRSKGRRVKGGVGEAWHLRSCRPCPACFLAPGDGEDLNEAFAFNGGILASLGPQGLGQFRPSLASCRHPAVTDAFSNERHELKASSLALRSGCLDGCFSGPRQTPN